MKLISRFFGILFSALIAGTASAQPYPNKVVRIISGYEVGGGATVGLHLFAEEMGNQLNTKFIVDSRPGASFSIAARAVRNAAPDGYTVYAGGIGSDPLLYKNGMRVIGELKPVSMVTEIPLVFFTNTAKGLKSMAAVVAYAKEKPDKLNFASIGGSVYLNLMMSVLASRLGGFSYVNIPYKGAPQAQMALISGEVDITLISIRSGQAGLDSGRITPILVGAVKRSPLLPHVPSLEEVGLQNIAVDSKVGLWAPPGTPAAIINMLSDAAQAIVKNPAYNEKFTNVLGASPLGTTPEGMERRFEQEFRLMQEGVRLSNYEPR